MQVHWYPQAQFAGYLMAQEKGYFNEAGLGNVEIRWSRAGESALQQLVDGKADFCTGWLSDAIVRRTKGGPVVLLAQVIERSTMMLVARSDSGIRRPEDMTGRRVGLWGGDFDVLPTAFFKKFDVKPEIVPQSNSIVPFLRKAVDVASAMHYNEYHKLFEAGLRREDLRVFLLSNYGLNFPEDGLYCTRSTRQDHCDLCSEVVLAVRRGWAYALTHESETLDAIMAWCDRANVRTNRNHQGWMLASIGQVVSPPDDGDPGQWGVLPRSTYSEVTRLLGAQGVIDQPPAFDEFHQPPGPADAREIPSSQ